MLRRKIFIYCLMLIAGIITGYLLCERLSIVSSLLLTASSLLIIKEIDLEAEMIVANRERQIMAVVMLFGFFLFIFNYIDYNSTLVDSENNVTRAEDVSSFDGTITFISKKDDSYRMIVRPKTLKHANKIEASYYQELPFESDLYELIGTSITLYGKLRKPEKQQNPGCFNYQMYQYSRGISYNFSSKYIRINKKSNALVWKYKRRVYRIRDAFLNNFDGETRAFLKGVIFGDKTDLSDDIIEELNENSTGHILAVSGLHVGFLFALLRFLTKKRKNIFTTAMVVCVLILYGEMTAWSPATIRAVLILGINLLSIYARRTPDLLSSLSISAIIILLFNPYMLFNSGFQMSFVALLSLVFLTEPFEHFLGKAAAPIGAIQIGVTPLIAFTFNRINSISFLINIPIVFLCSILVPTSIIGMFIVISIGALPNLIVKIISFIANLILSTNHLLGVNGFTTTNVISLNPALILSFYILLFALSSEWFRVKALRGQRKYALKIISIILIPTILISFSFHNKYLNDEIIFVSVGQGDCTHISYQSNDVLIDGGGDRNFNIAEKTLKPYLLKNGVVNLDAALVTHLHMDHYKGLQELDNCFPVGEICIGASIKFNDEFYIKAIWPKGNRRLKFTDDDPNENNTVYIIYCYGKKVMITGDLTEQDEKKMIKYYKGRDTLDCDVLKVGHHGSKTSTCEEFLDATTPEIAIISVGANNMYGHPHQETLDKLSSRGISIYRTDLNGAVGIDVKSNIIKVDTMR